MKFSIYQESRPGSRPNNEDRVAYCYSRDALMMVVADGMGGHLHGEIASQLAASYITEAFKSAARPQIDDPALFLARALMNAHNAIQDYAFDRRLPDAPRTTIVACLIQNSVAHWAHAGDSRLYLLRHNRVFTQTRDHSRLQLMIEQGLIDPLAAAQHPARNRIFSCLGGSHTPQVEFSKAVPLFADDLLLLCTDGFWGNLSEDQLTEELTGADILTQVPRLLDRAEVAGGLSCDNLSVIAMRWHDDYAEDPPSSVSTATMPLDSFTTQMEGASRPERLPDGAGNLTDDDIERAIAEINDAIRKFTRLDRK